MKLYRPGKRRGDTASPPVKLSYDQLEANAIDSQLASLAAAGNDSAFTTLVTRFQPAVFRWARSNGSAYYLPSSEISAITVRGTPREIETSRNLIREFEEDPTAACRVPTMIGHPALTGPLGTAGPGTLLGEPGTQHIDLGARGSGGPVPAPEKVTTPPKK